MRIRSLNGLLLASILALNAIGSPLNDLSAYQSKSSQPIPSPLVIPASQYFDGDDGVWSSLALRIGNPVQDVRVLVSTNSPQTLVVLPLGCTSEAISPVPSGCANARGGLFNSSLSNTWDDRGVFEINGDGVGFQADLGYSQAANFGLDSIGLGYVSGTNGPTLDNQTIGAIATASPFYTGVFGLGTQPVNFTTIGNSSARSYFSSLWSEKLIPSLAWSYTAGAKYRLKAGQYAQLIFGGYDTSRFIPNSASFTLYPDVNRDIVVAVQAITYSGTQQVSLLADPIYAFIESTDSNIWLPETACEEFEKAFGLLLDNTTGLYLINSTQYSLLAKTNPQVTFTLANSLVGGDTASIILPFNAFALPATYPFVPNDTYYFPLRKSANESQNTLGRAFLQEAYLTVDYERGNFTVSQCTWIDGATSEISSIISPTLTSNSSNIPQGSPSAYSSNPTTNLSIGVICVIVVMMVVAIAAGVFGGLYLYRRHKRPKSTAEIALRGNEENFPKDGTRMTHSSNRLSDYYQQDIKVPFVEAPGHETREPVELQSSHLNNHSDPTNLITKPAEIFAKTSEDPYENFAITARRIDSQKEFATASEMDTDSAVFELPGCFPLVEMDDESGYTASSSSVKSPVSRQSSFQTSDSLLSRNSSYQIRSPALSPTISAKSSSLRISSSQGRISPFVGLTRHSSIISNSDPIDRRPSPSSNLEPLIEWNNPLQRTDTGNSGISGISEFSIGTPLSATSPTLERPPSIFKLTFSRPGKPVWSWIRAPAIPSRASSNATSGTGGTESPKP
ncbi:hypothetical protein EYC80_006422 [Monilinia laxa]|uniref:Peptidase A1 domain-containing protein n=1 Tax=Monilinia laxa TaxID=61186 RepID=A0A5N6JRW7_MONLA|nr:hypothetical protein EYC80_006422 [Monilinia laxa]